MQDFVPPRVRTAVPCDYHGCRQAAAMVELLPGPGDGSTLLVGGFAEGTDVAEPLRDHRLVAQIRASAGSLADTLYDRDPAWAPFFCATCERSYCATHWHAGRCPYGHA